jgi:sec-independent protein translocase protein TatC
MEELSKTNPDDKSLTVSSSLAEPDGHERTVMTIVEHLDELRTRLLRCIVVLILSFFVTLAVSKDIVRFLEAPAGNITFQALSLEEPILVFFKVAFYAACVLALPYVLFEASRFVAPGLRAQERRVLAPVVLGGPLLFICGAAFAYYLVLPPMLHFFGSFGQGITPIHQRLDFYISLVSSILLYMGLCFQLPILLFALSFTGLVHSRNLLSFWRYAIVGSALVAAIITPDPTAISMLIVMGALVGLYFISVLLLRLFGR